jgi:hypothetical protein
VLEHLQSCDGPCINTLTIEIEKDFLKGSYQSIRYFQWQVDLPLAHHVEKDINGNVSFETFTYDGLDFGTVKQNKKNGDILEETRLNGQRHGLYRVIKNGITVKNEYWFLGEKFGMQVEKFDNGNFKSKLFYFGD